MTEVRGSHFRVSFKSVVIGPGARRLRLGAGSSTDNHHELTAMSRAAAAAPSPTGVLTRTLRKKTAASGLVNRGDVTVGMLPLACCLYRGGPAAAGGGRRGCPLRGVAFAPVASQGQGTGPGTV